MNRCTFDDFFYVKANSAMSTSYADPHISVASRKFKELEISPYEPIDFIVLVLPWRFASTINHNSHTIHRYLKRAGLLSIYEDEFTRITHLRAVQDDNFRLDGLFASTGPYRSECTFHLHNSIYIWWLYFARLNVTCVEVVDEKRH